MHDIDTGSPPPTRGTLYGEDEKYIYSGITPAYAGNTEKKTEIVITAEDHPRLRGEHLLLSDNPNLFWGSPPPTRGTHIENDVKGLYEGITPAYAGNTYILLMS